jgi:hypothetical protein
VNLDDATKEDSDQQADPGQNFRKKLVRVSGTHIFADENADEARGAAEAESRGQRVGGSFGTGGGDESGVFWDSRDGVLGQFCDRFRPKSEALEKATAETAVKSRIFRVGA